MHRLLLILVGLLMLALGAAGMYVAVKGGGVVHFVMEGLRGVFFTLLGVGIVAVAVTCDPEFARSMLREYVRDVFSRRNLIEFAVFWLVVGLAVLVMLMLRP